MIQTLERAHLLGELFAAGIRHHIDLPHQDSWLLLERRWVSSLDVGLHPRAVLYIDENERLDFAVGEELCSPRSKSAIGTCDQDRLAFVGFGGDCEFGVALLPEILIGEYLSDEHWHAK